ncbi:MAG: beta-ketoacyl-ACP synthase II [bacterium]
MENRVVVTGMGGITPVGHTIEEFWNSLVNGVSGVDYISRFDTAEFDTKFAAEIKGFNIEDFVDKKEARRMDIFTHYAVAASKLAVEDSGLDFTKEDTTRVGVIVSSGIGGMTTFEREYRNLFEKGPKRISPFFIPMMIADISPGYISMIFGLKGPNFATTSACASSSNAIGDAFRIIQRRDAEIMIAGGSEAPITPMGIGGFNAMKAISTRNHEPKKASRPFDAQRDGFVMGEGAGIIVLESLEHALARGAKIYCEIIGIGCTADAYHITAPDPKGEGATLAMRFALEDANVRPEEVDYVNAHGTSTEYNDEVETIAIKKVFGEHAYNLHVSSTKSMTGHLLGAAGVVELMATALSMVHSVIHPTINYDYPDPKCDLNYTPNEAVKKDVNVAITNSFGFGGHNVCIVLRKYDQGSS